MEIKKNPNVDLERRSGLFLNIGLCVSLLLVITAFEWRFYDRGAGMDLGTIEDDFEDWPCAQSKESVTDRLRLSRNQLYSII